MPRTLFPRGTSVLRHSSPEFLDTPQLASIPMVYFSEDVTEELIWVIISHTTLHTYNSPPPMMVSFSELISIIKCAYVTLANVFTSYLN